MLYSEKLLDSLKVLFVVMRKFIVVVNDSIFQDGYRLQNNKTVGEDKNRQQQKTIKKPKI